MAVLFAPAQHAEQLAWVRRARPLLSRELKREIRHFAFLFARTPEVFPGVWPATEQRDVAQELATLRRSLRAYSDALLIRLSGERLIDDLRVAQLRKKRWYRAAARRYGEDHPETRAMLEEFVDSPTRSLERLCGALESFYDGVMQPLFGPIDTRLRRDVEMRKMLLGHGLAALLRTLTAELSVERESARQCTIRFGAQDKARTFAEHSTLTLVPSYFSWPHMQAFLFQRRHGALDCTIVYPLPTLSSSAHGIPNPKAATRLLSALGESSRLRIVELLAQRDLSTRELAGFLRTSEPVVSRHLRVLYEAGAVDRRRHSYFVLYTLRREALQEIGDVLSGLSQ